MSGSYPDQPRGESSHQEGKYAHPRRVGIYYGESSRLMYYERSREHVNDAENFQEGSHIVRHWMEYHQDDYCRTIFKFNVLDSFKDCLSQY